MKLRRTLAVCLMAMSVALMPISSASAATGVGGVGVSIGGVIGEQIVAQGTYTGQLTGPNSLLIEFACAAEAYPTAVSTSINSCTLSTPTGTFSAQPRALPGPASATASTASTTLGTVTLCWSASAVFLSSNTRTTSGCTTVNL